MSEFYSNGKLLLTGEYLVLDGGLALAVPTKFGQSLSVSKTDKPTISWESLDHESKSWFSMELKISDVISGKNSSSNEIETRLKSILHQAYKLNPDFLNSGIGYDVKSNLSFPRYWGLGTSSTLINNIANWANVDAFKLLDKTFGGSGYDIACAGSRMPILYSLKNGHAEISKVDFNPTFKEELYFVYLNKKQNSRDGISQYKALNDSVEKELEALNSLTQLILASTSLEEFSTLITAHENLISSLIRLKPVKEELFDDFKGAIKSLGAWGGDFVLAASHSDPSDYFKNKGYDTVIPYIKMVL
ncbi:DNA phosphorothioation-dependent restriction protein DptG [Flavobacteriaceae bacterium MAR_2010_188]|nr:DNA phosphorothioation-dependent restriction protein DptG [Flavobacteriaceae bacterium MAR_2010_188]